MEEVSLGVIRAVDVEVNLGNHCTVEVNLGKPVTEAAIFDTTVLEVCYRFKGDHGTDLEVVSAFDAGIFPTVG